MQVHDKRKVQFSGILVMKTKAPGAATAQKNMNAGWEPKWIKTPERLV